MLDELLEAWRTNNRINLFLIDRISDAGMKCTLSKRGGRDVARQFAHLHNVRVWHLEKRARDLAEGLAVFETKLTPSKAAGHEEGCVHHSGLLHRARESPPGQHTAHTEGVRS